jgi:AraC-like DNA-binding protein
MASTIALEKGNYEETLVYSSVTIHVRTQWVAGVIRELQVALIEALSIDRDAARISLLSRARAIPSPAGPLEALLLRGLLLEFAWRFGTDFHKRFHRLPNYRCAFSPALILEREWPKAMIGQHGLRRWIVAFFVEFDRIHAPTIAERAARILRCDFTHRWTVTMLAGKLGAKTSALSSGFKREYGISIKEFQRRLRICAAIERVRSEKIETIALEMGYRSKKDFYKGFVALTGMKPSEFRNVPPSRVSDIMETVKRRVGCALVQSPIRKDR